MILTKRQADIVRVMLSVDTLVIGKVKHVGSRIVFDEKTGIALLDSDYVSREPLTVHGHVFNGLLEKGLLSSVKDENYRLSDEARAINSDDLVNFTFKGVPRVTDEGIKDMAAKYGYDFEFQRVVGIAMFTKNGDAVVETSIRIDRLSDKSITEWEQHLSDYIKTL